MLIDLKKIYTIFSSTFFLFAPASASASGSASGSIKFSVKFFVRVHFPKTIKGIHLKLGILVHYPKRHQLQ